MPLEKIPPFVLIVDDSKSIRLAIGEMMKKQGYVVDYAEDGIVALEKVEQKPPDLILLDVVMPRMDGMTFSKKVKSNQLTQHIPIIFLTSQNKSETIIQAFESGAVDYVTKPCNHVELLARVNTHLDLKRTKEEVIKKNSELNELVHVLCHDLVNPLVAIQSTLELSVNKSEDWLSSRCDRLIQVTQHGLNVIELIRKLRYLEEKDNALKLTQVNLKNSLEECYDILQQLFVQKDVAFNLNIDEKLSVQVERTSFINSVLNNILTNAVKFSHPKSTIAVSACEIGELVELTIRDFGIGMPVEILKHLFNIGKGRSRVGTNGERGTGFGMPLIRNFIKAYGGTLEIWSKEPDSSVDDYGTKVTIFLKKV